MLRQDRDLTLPPPWHNHLDPMSREDEAKNDRLFDSRTVERNIRKGLITRKDYEKHLKGLVDVTDKIAPPEAPRSVTMSAVAEPDVDHLDAGLDDDDDEDQVRHVAAPLDGQSTAGADDELAEGDLDELDDDDLEDDDEDEVDTEPPKN
jgi:hypothetical protein